MKFLLKNKRAILIFIILLIIYSVAATYENISLNNKLEVLQKNFAPVNQLYNFRQFLNSYVSEKGKLKIDFPETMYVSEDIKIPNNGLQSGKIIVSLYPYKQNEENAYLVIDYGIPYIDGKGGACVNMEGNLTYKSGMILGQEVLICDDNKERLGVGYPKHPTEKIDYHIYIKVNKGITKSEFNKYRDIVYSGLEFIE